MNLFNIFSKSLLYLLFFALLLPSPAAAQDQARLTEQGIRDFIQKTSDIAAGKTGDMTAEDLTAFLQAHLHRDARFKSNMTYVIPGQPSRKTDLALDKEEFIKSVLAGRENMDGYSNEIKIKSVRISSDGRKATVTTTGKEKGIMKAPIEGTIQDLPINGRSTCDQIIMMGETDIVQMYSANCNTEILFEEF